MPLESLKTVGALGAALTQTVVGRLRRGPKLPGWSFQMELLTTFLQGRMGRVAALDSGPAQRAVVDAIAAPMPALKRVRVEPWNEGALAGRWLTPKQGASDRTLLYLHGGGYAVYAKGHINLEALVALACNARTLAPDYRLAPEHPYPAALDDALAAYKWLLDHGTDPKRLIVSGDSAGGGLSAALLLKLREEGLPLPALGVLISPWVDLACTRPSMQANAPYDWISPQLAKVWSGFYRSGRAADDPLISPIHGNLEGLPPLLVQVGKAEILHDQGKEFAERAARQGVSVMFEAWDEMNHEFHSFAPRVEEASDALASITQKVNAALGR